jgi:hypothetical protein
MGNGPSDLGGDKKKDQAPKKKSVGGAALIV